LQLLRVRNRSQLGFRKSILTEKFGVASELEPQTDGIIAALALACKVLIRFWVHRSLEVFQTLCLDVVLEWGWVYARNQRRSE
jgi:hypothetical protein